MVYLHKGDFLLLQLALFTQVGILLFLTLEIRIHSSKQLVNVVSKFNYFYNFAAIIRILHFAVIPLFFRLLFFDTSLNLTVKAEVLFDVEEYLLELSQFDISLNEFVLQRLHVVIDVLGFLTLLTFVF